MRKKNKLNGKFILEKDITDDTQFEEEKDKFDIQEVILDILKKSNESGGNNGE